MYSRPTSTTFAAFTIASAASTAPTNPLVSIIPSASIFIEESPPSASLSETETNKTGHGASSTPHLEHNSADLTDRADSIRKDQSDLRNTWFIFVSSELPTPSDP